jgi:hypothetical protein
MDGAPEAAGGGVVASVSLGVDAVDAAPGVVGVEVDTSHAIVSTIKMMATPERVQPFFIFSSLRRR